MKQMSPFLNKNVNHTVDSYKFLNDWRI